MLYSYSITPLADNEFESRARDIVAQVKRGAFLMPLFSMTLTPEGDPVWDKASKMAKLYARYRDRLAEDNVDAGILVQACMGHGYAITRNPFQLYVNFNDGEESFVCCPMDEKFLNHFADVLRTLAREKPKAIMLDDDFRLMMRPGRGCACPLHMAEFNRRAGTNMSREELLAHISSHDKSDKLKRIFEDTQRDALVNAAKVFRAAIDEIDPSIQGINCTSGKLCESVMYTNKIFAGKGNPTMVRVPNGCYAPHSVRDFSSGMRNAAICGSRLRKHGINILLAETDTIPFNRYAKSARYLHAHFTSSILEGLKGAKHWLTRTSAFEPESGKAYRDILAKHSGMYEKLADISDNIKFIGCNSAFIEQEENDFNAEDCYDYLTNYWVTKNLERMGLPFYFSDKSEAASFLEGDLVKEMTDEQIKTVFEGSVFVDGDSAMELCRRGYGDLLGVKAEEWDLGTITGETFDGTLYQCCTGQKNAKKITVVNSKTEVLSNNYLRADGYAKILAPAVTVYERENGKISVVYCGSPLAAFNYMEGFAFLNETRKAQFVTLLKRTGALPIYFAGDDEICLRAGYLPDGRLLAAIFELGIDPVEEPKLYLEKKPESITMTLPDGTEAPVKFEAVGENIYTVDIRIEPMYPVILFIK